MKKLSDAFLPFEHPFKDLQSIFQIGNLNCFDILSDQTDVNSKAIVDMAQECLDILKSPHRDDLDISTAKNFVTTNFRIESTGGFISVVIYQLGEEQNPHYSNITIVIGHADMDADGIPEAIYPHFSMTASIIGNNFIPQDCRCVKIIDEEADNNEDVEQRDLLIAQNDKEFMAMICYANDAFENIMAGYLPEVENYQQWVDPESFFDPESTYKRLCKRTPQSLTEDIKNGESDGNSQIVEDNIRCFPPPMMQ